MSSSGRQIWNVLMSVVLAVGWERAISAEQLASNTVGVESDNTKRVSSLEDNAKFVRSFENNATLMSSFEDNTAFVSFLEDIATIPSGNINGTLSSPTKSTFRNTNATSLLVTSSAIGQISGVFENTTCVNHTTDIPIIPSDISLVVTKDLRNRTETVGSNFTSSIQSSDSNLILKTIKTVALIISIIVATLGFALNTPCMIYFWRSEVSVNNTYMLALLFFDTFVCLITIPESVLGFVYYGSRYLPLPYAYYNLYVETNLAIATRQVIFLVTSLMCLERFLFVTFPLKIWRLNPLRRPRLAVGLSVCVIYAYTAFETVMRLEVIPVTGINVSDLAIIDVTRISMENNYQMEKLLLGVNTVVRFVPYTVIIISNVGLVVFLSRHTRRMRNFRITELRRSEVSGSLVVVVYTFVYLLLSVPFTVILTIYTLAPAIMMSNPNVFSLSLTVSTFLEVVSSSINFFVFFATSRSFRREVKKFFCKSSTSNSVLSSATLSDRVMD